jgi:2,3-bisphosphoglycerate-dependent phosphoglycerate mutase
MNVFLFEPVIKKRKECISFMRHIMKSLLILFRHSETFDNFYDVFSGWRDSTLTSRGLSQAKQIAKQLKPYPIDCAFTSHLRRSKESLEIILQGRPPTKIFVDDRLIERCYGLLQGKKKSKVATDNPDLYGQVHRGYDFIPPMGESFTMVEKQNPCNVAISCHGNSIRPIMRIFENLSIEEMLQLEVPQDSALVYELKCDVGNEYSAERATNLNWDGIVLSRKVKFAVDPLNLLSIYY